MNEVGVKRRVRSVWAKCARLDPGTALRVLLILFVGVSLTLVCQGHNGGGHHMGVHLIFAPEPEESTGETGIPYFAAIQQENGGVQDSGVKAQSSQTICQTQL